MSERELRKPAEIQPTQLSELSLASVAFLPPNRLQNAARVDGPLIALPAATFSSYVFEQATASEFRSLTTRLGWKATESGLIDPWKGATRAITQTNMREQMIAMREAGQLVGKTEQQMLTSMSRRGALKGFAGAGLAIGANIAMDAYVFSNHRYGTFSAIADGLVLPGLAISPLPWHIKGGLMIGAHALGRIVDR